MTDIHHAIDQLQPDTVAVLGVPFDEHSSYKRGPALAPPLIRDMLYCDATNLSTESGRDLGTRQGWCDLGDLDLVDGNTAFSQIEKAAAAILKQDARLVALGGDHAVTWPLVNAFARRYPELNILHLDAHPDLYDELAGNRLSHACPFARIMEQWPRARLVQVGIRTMIPHQRAQAQRFGVEVRDMRSHKSFSLPEFDGPVYLSLDLDCLDPAFAPGVSHQEPGGLSTREVLDIIQGFTGDLVGADIVEYNPHCDVNSTTARVAAKFLKEIIDRIIIPL